MNTANPSVSKNAWRIGSPGVEGWKRTARAGDPNKYFMVSADCHVTESLAFLNGIEPRYRDRIPRVVENADGSQHLITEGNRPQLVRSATKGAPAEKREPYERP
jgi:hypothetical protein